MSRPPIEVGTGHNAGIIELEPDADRRFRLWPFDVEAARECGRLEAELRRRGRPMQTVDIMIAAIAFRLGKGVVISSDSDLTAIPGLEVENWVA